KPSNWNEIISANPYNESNDVYFHFVISTNQVDLTSLPYPQLEFNGKVFGEYQAKYRLMKYVSARSPNIIQDGNRLSYTIKGLELFKGEDADGISDNDIPNPDKYPTFLIPNKIYFLQMYTASGAYKGSTDPEFISEKSVPVSFTTLTMGGREVPLPMNLRLNKNGSETIAGPPVVFSNYLELQFDKIKVNWMDYTTNMSVTKSIYYDLYSSSSTATDSFIKIGSTENPIGDVKFVGIDVQSSSIKATLRNFSNDTDAYNIFGPKLKPNATYYYMIKTRLAFGSSTQESMFTSILSVTTVNGNISPPDETSRNPIAPVDFSIAKDSSGNQLVSGSTAVFQWTNKEPDVSYEMICTSATIATNAPLSAYTDDIYYNSFKAAFGDLLLDPGAIPLADNFKYDSLSKKCNYTLDQWISPNKLYFISIRAVNNTTGKVSAWVCIPLTTLLIESPASINAVTDSEIAIYWQDKSASATPDDFKLFLKGPDDNNYKELSRSQFIVSKENNIYYGRIFNLKYDATYNVKVLKGDSDSTLVLEKLNIATMDKAHTVEVKWKGRIGYNYEIGIKSADDVDYTIVTASDLEEVTNSDGKVSPYYIEKSPDVTGTTFYNFYGKIKTVATTQIDGTVKHVPLKSNMKYYVKVRAYKVDSLDSTIVSYSKYLGPIDVRTEFNQDDYDNTDQDTKKKAILLDKIGKLEEELLWKMSVNSNVNKLLLKGDRMINALQNNGRYPYILDISSMSSNVDQDVLYIPTKVVRLLNTEDRSLVIKTSGAEFTIRPRTLDIDAINSSNNINTENDFFKMTATRSDGGISLPQNASLASKITTISLTALDTQKDDTEIESLVKDKLYNDKTGLIQERVNLVLSTNSVKLTPGEMDYFLTDQSLELEMELASYIQKLIEGSGSVLGIIKTESPVTLFNDPLLVKIAYSNSQGKLYPYVLSDGGGSWKKLTDSAYTQTNIDISFSTLSTGKYAVLTAQTSSIDIPQNSKVADDLNKLSKRYDLSSVFGTGSSFYPENTITVKEIVDLYEVLSGKGSNWAGLDTKQKISKLGLSDAFGGVNTMKGLEKQELSAVVGKLYTSRMGIDINSFMPAKKLQITDEADINAKRVKYVTLCLDIKVFSLDEKGYFKPGVTMTRADAVAAFVKVLDITGDLS
ncbi:MAG: ferrous iron transporter A, partial [Bacillota bacterium]|nr:ferrous iron transporter A [Bacillota bacterium]